MVIGCVRELVDVSVGGAPVADEIAPAGAATTDSSVVGNWPVAVPFGFTAGVPAQSARWQRPSYPSLEILVEHSRQGEA